MLSALLVIANPAAQAQGAAGQLPALIIGNDRGGALEDRLRQIRRLRGEGREVRITGRVCYSTCTMLIGLPNACISPKTRFGFHAPSRAFGPLDPETFDYASRVIAHYYPAPLKRWYLETGRHRMNGIYQIEGARLIAMGVPRCPA